MPISIYQHIPILYSYRAFRRNHISNYTFLLSIPISHVNVPNALQDYGYTLQLHNDIILFKKLH